MKKEQVNLNSQLIKAIELACRVHDLQLDKGGQSYILHPLKVMDMCETIEEKIVAVLHDTIEDSSHPKMTENSIEKTFSSDVLEAVRCLTRRKGVSYNEYLKNVKTNELARIVKIADLTHNMDLSRLGDNVSQRDLERVFKYKRAMEFLTECE